MLKGRLHIWFVGFNNGEMAWRLERPDMPSFVTFNVTWSIVLPMDLMCVCWECKLTWSLKARLSELTILHFCPIELRFPIGVFAIWWIRSIAGGGSKLHNTAAYLEPLGYNGNNGGTIVNGGRIDDVHNIDHSRKMAIWCNVFCPPTSLTMVIGGAYPPTLPSNPSTMKSWHRQLGLARNISNVAFSFVNINARKIVGYVCFTHICICLRLLSLTPVPVSCRWDVTSLWPRGSSHPLCLCSDSSICCKCLCLFISALPFSYNTTLFRAQDVDTRPRDSCIRYSHPALVAASQNEKMDF